MSYKVYFKVTIDILVKLFPKIVEKIDIDFSSLYEKNHYYVIRLDKKKKIISTKVEFQYNTKDYNKFKKYINLPQQFIDKTHINVIGFEFESDKISKINIYYRNNF